jgi:hypothetical protein
MIFGVFASFSVCAQTPIGFLDFELNDLTLQPNMPEEIERTASIRPLLEKSFLSKGGYRIVSIHPEAQAEANQGFGYLFDHHDVAAQLGATAGADWVVVGRVHKASFLFVYFKAHLINAKTKQIVGDYVVEVKGPQKKLTIKGVENLAEQIDATLRKETSTNAAKPSL